MAEQMNIYQKLARIRKQVEVIQKNKSGYGYKYVSEDEILAKISVFMDKYGLSLIPNIKQGSTIVSPYTYKKTKTTPRRMSSVTSATPTKASLLQAKSLRC